MQAKMLYVVIVETGEYSDRNDWVGGVFDDKETAQRTIVEKSAASCEFAIRYDAWLDGKWVVIKKNKWPNSWDWDLEKRAEYMAIIEREIGPEPRGESGERFYLVEVPLNQWGEFRYAGYEPVDTGYPCGTITRSD